MATLITTPGAANANSYATVEEALAYHEGRLYSEPWENAENPEAALIFAARLLDGSFIWTGQATFETQALTWPRIGMLNRNGFLIPSTTIPNELKNAQAEWARLLTVADLAADDDVVKKRITSIRAGSVALSFANPDHSRDKFGIWPDVTNVDFVPDMVRILLVPSWYERPVTQLEAEFETVG